MNEKNVMETYSQAIYEKQQIQNYGNFKMQWSYNLSLKNIENICSMQLKLY